MSETPEPVDLEIIEYGPSSDDPFGAVLLPSEVRLNGRPVLTPDRRPVVVHNIEVGADAVLVTVTMFARRVVVERRPPLTK